MKLTFQTLVLLAGVAAPWGPLRADAPAPSADPKARAAALSAQAYEMFDQGDWAAGVELLTGAFEAFPDPDLLLNRAVAFEQWGAHCAEALAGYERYFAYCEGRTCAHEDAARKREALYRERCLVPVEVKSEPAGAAVFDGASALGPAPLTLRLTPGEHRLTARLTGYSDVTESVTVHDGQPAAVVLQLAAPASSAGVATSVGPPASGVPDRRDGRRIGAYVGLGVGAAATIAGTVFLFAHLDARDERNSAAGDTSVSLARLDALEEDANRDWALAWTGFGLGAAGLGTAAALFLWSGGDETGGSSVHSTVGPGWASVSGWF